MGKIYSVQHLIYLFILYPLFLPFSSNAAYTALLYFILTITLWVDNTECE